MKIQMRQGVFETNSSSMHSLVVKKTERIVSGEELKRGMYLGNDGIWDIWNDSELSFGRYPFECLHLFTEKVRYSIASLCGYREDAKEKFEEIKSIVMELVPDCTDIRLPVERYGNKSEICYGYVDEDILSGFLKKENIELREFLTNQKYVVIVDGDEYCIWNSMKKSNLVNESLIEKEYPERSNYWD